MEAHRPAAAATRRRATTVRRGICYSRSMLSPLLPGPPVPPLFASSVDDRGNARTTRVRPNDPVSADPLTILVVDDDPANLALAQALLEAEGYNVWGATDGKSMFARLRGGTPALILMDIQLPEVDGWELTRQLKADAATRDIPVILYTSPSPR